MFLVSLQEAGVSSIRDALRYVKGRPTGVVDSKRKMCMYVIGNIRYLCRLPAFPERKTSTRNYELSIETRRTGTTALTARGANVGLDRKGRTISTDYCSESTKKISARRRGQDGSHGFIVRTYFVAASPIRMLSHLAALIYGVCNTKHSYIMAMIRI